MSVWPIAAGDARLTATVGVLALQGAFALHVQALERCGVSATEVRQAGQLSGLDGLILPGGESTTMIKLMTRFDLVEPLAKFLADGLPVFGTCAGMILLAREVTDGHPDQMCFAAIDLVVARNGYGRQIDSFEADIEVDGLEDLAREVGGPMRAVFIRAPVVERAGPDVEVLAQIDGSPVLCRQDNVLVSSFHPELSDDDRLHRAFVASLRS